MKTGDRFYWEQMIPIFRVLLLFLLLLLLLPMTYLYELDSISRQSTAGLILCDFLSKKKKKNICKSSF